MRKKEVPTFDELMDPTVQALKRLGGSASIDELVPEIVRLLNLPQEVADVPHGTTAERSWSIGQRGRGPTSGRLG